MEPVILINAVGLTPRLLELAPRLGEVARAGWAVPVWEVVPAVTCTAQATILTGTLPREHGVVANGWLYRDTGEVRFWQQSNRLMRGEPLYVTARRRAQARGRAFKSAKLFWWFNQGAAVDIAVTPKPWYGIDGDKVFGISGTPDGLTDRLERKLGRFPFRTFWGPTAGLPSTRWIARCAAEVLRDERPDLTMAYLPHLDYDPQRYGPSGTDMARCVRQLDDACAPLLEAAKEAGAKVWVVSEYGHCDVTRPVYVNRVLRERKWLAVRPGPFGEQLDTFGSRAFAVCDHQVAHVYVRDPADVPRVRELLAGVDGVARMLVGHGKADVGLDHPRSGEIVLLSARDAWFAYPFWLDDALAPDYARAVAIHQKPGFDPCEMFFDPRLRFPRAYAARKVLRKKLGFRMVMDVVPLDASIVRGSHGLPAEDSRDRAILIGHGPRPDGEVGMEQVKDLLLRGMGLGEE